MNRRSFLAVSGVASLSTGFAGCVQNEDSSSGDKLKNNMKEKTRSPPAENPRDIRLRNGHDMIHTLELKVELDDDLIHSDKYTLDSGNQKYIKDIADEVGGYLITVSLTDTHETTERWSVTDTSTVALIYITDQEKLTLSLNPRV